jgi:hypothetical protein
MGLNWFNAVKAKEFGTSLAVFFIEKLPVDSSQKIDDDHFARKTKKVLAAIETQVEEFKKDNTLNIYKRAQLGNAFKWKLKEAGYAPEYINELTLWLVKQL